LVSHEIEMRWTLWAASLSLSGYRSGADFVFSSRDNGFDGFSCAE